MPSQPAVDPFDQLTRELRDRLTVSGRLYLVPLGDLYVHAFSDAARIRETAMEEPFQTLRIGRKLENPAFVTVDRLIRTALQLAKTLELHRPIEPADEGPFDVLDGLGLPRRKSTKK
jgi:hypothetical protein